ncbi:hypothetical protein [Salinibacter grassmerensis]|uniref:hypothetical protein n=1 Tax=Salinibacter grassmerensis TaxID=3040353 RepID=UPI0021E8CD17|nr:hypothetical protein [Salinibacter grassmerensis]
MTSESDPSERSEGDTRSDESFSQWLAEPQTMIGLSAVLLSLCGLFVSIYETRLMRQEQWASVWPRVSVGPSLNTRSDTVEIKVRNSGIGPARIRAARIEHEGKQKANWQDLLESVGQPGASRNFGLINRQVLSPGEDEVIFTAVSDSSERNPKGLPPLAQEILDGDVDLVLCYCSAYDECWITTMQRHLGIMPIMAAQSSSSSDERTQEEVYEKTESCQGVKPSGI